MLFKKKNSHRKRAERASYKLGAELDFASTEAYNLLRTNLTFSFPDKKEGKIVGVTSPCPHEGKSFTTINLSYSLAEAGHKVILVDSDMRCSKFSGTLGLPASPGLSNLLIDDVMETLHEEVLHPNLTVCMAGDTPPNPAKLLGSEKMKKVLDSLSRHYDYVIVDLPPVTAVSDALEVSKFLDGVIVVVRHAQTTRGDLVEAVRRLKFVGAHLLGFVYNGYSKPGSGYYKSSRYYKNAN